MQENQNLEPEEPPLFGFIDAETSLCALDTDIAPVIVERTGDPSCEAQIMYNTRDNTAVAGVHYIQTEGELSFEVNEMSKVIRVPLVGDIKYDEAKSFTIELGYCSVGDDAIALYETKVILDPTSEDVTQSNQYNEDDPGLLGFRSQRLEVSEIGLEYGQSKKINIPVDRTEGVTGDVSVEYSTRDNTAVAGVHYVESGGELAFADGQTENFIPVDILTTATDYDQLSFNVELGGTTGGADVGLYETEVILQVRSSHILIVYFLATSVILRQGNWSAQST